MSRASAIEHVRRVNLVIGFLKEKIPSREARCRLRERFGLSPRQTYRYLREARALAAPLVLPEVKRRFHHQTAAPAHCSGAAGGAGPGSTDQ